MVRIRLSFQRNLLDMAHKLRSRDLTYEWETDYYPWLYALPAMIERKIVIDLFFILFESYMNLKKYISS